MKASKSSSSSTLYWLALLSWHFHHTGLCSPCDGLQSAKAAALDPRIKNLNRGPILALKSLVTAMISHATPGGAAGGGEAGVRAMGKSQIDSNFKR